MAGRRSTGIRRALGVFLIAAAAALGASMVIGTQHAAALVAVPNKTCTDPSAGGRTGAQPGDTIVCDVFLSGVIATGDTLTVQPGAPAGAFVSGCTQLSTPQGSGLTYTTAVAQSNGGCAWTITVITPLPLGVTAGNNKMGTELLTLPDNAASGTSVTQQASQCGPPDAVTHNRVCSPFLPMGTAGPASCIGGTALPVIGGCAPSLPASSSPTPSQSGNGGNGGGTGTGTTGQTQSSSAAAVATTTKTPFTSGPEHPLPVAAALVAVGGLGVAGLALVAPPFLRRRRRDI